MLPDKIWFILAGAMALASVSLTAASAKIVTRTVAYRHDGTEMRGFLAYDDAITGKRPGVLVVHEWWGLNDFARERALKLAGLGYMALAAALLRDPDLLRARARAALAALAADPRVDPKRLAAIGFCFGGTTVLELAYSGADLAGVASFHGGLPKTRPEDLKRIKAAVLVLHGADDPHVSAADIAAFEQAMRQAGADWQMVLFGGAVHSFTNPAAGNNPAAGVAYNARAARRSWRYLQDFFQEIWRVKGRD
jgi:dienelactone hydrolase